MDESKLLEAISIKLDQIVFILKAQNKSLLINEVKKIIKSREELNAYILTDGKSSIGDIVKKTGSKKPTIGVWWKKWVDYGIAIPGPVRSDRPQKVFTKDEIEKYLDFKV